jgi:hypothetical protein
MAEALAKAKLQKLLFHEFITTKFRGDGKQDPAAHVLLFTKLCAELKLITDAGVETSNDAKKEVQTLFFKSLSEKALLWFDSQEFTSLAQLTTEFLRHFSGSHGVSGDLTLFNNLSWSQGETALEFRNRLTKISSRLSLPDSLVKHRFIHGLPESVTNQLLPFYDHDIKTLMDMAQNLLSLQGQSKLVSGVSVNCAESATPELSKEPKHGLEAEVAAIRKELKELKLQHEVYTVASNTPPYSPYDDPYESADQFFGDSDHFESYYSSFPRYPSRGFNPRGRGGRSFRGFRRGGRRGNGTTHNSSNLDQGPSVPPSKETGEPREPGVCWFCKKKGHTWSRCFVLKQKLQAGDPVFH